VRALLDHTLPLAGLEVAAVPFDADGLLDSLAAAAPTPRPEFAELEERLTQFRPRAIPGEPDSNLTAAWHATRDSVRRLVDRLERMDRASPEYAAGYTRLRDLYARFTARQAAREAALRRLLSEDRSLADRAARAADSLRAWERVAYRDFPRLADARVRAAGRTVARATTDSAGRVVFQLSRGPWWVYARFTDPENPFIEFRWNVAATAAGLPFGLPLSRATSDSRWRH
jgi:hypothetical protein